MKKDSDSKIDLRDSAKKAPENKTEEAMSELEKELATTKETVRELYFVFCIMVVIVLNLGIFTIVGNWAAILVIAFLEVLILMIIANHMKVEAPFYRFIELLLRFMPQSNNQNQK